MIEEKVKVVHIHTDAKFIAGSDTFENPMIENLILVFTEEKQKKREGANYKYFSSSILRGECKKEDVNYAIELCSKADIVVMWGLWGIKSYLVTKLPDSVKIIWRFFGAELYDLHKNIFVSDLTNRYINTSKNKKSMMRKFFAKSVKFTLGRVHLPMINLRDITDRIDYFMGISDDEYDLIKREFLPNVPTFLQSPFRNTDDLSSPGLQADKFRIIIGINKSIWCNYLDVLEGVEGEGRSSEFEFDVLFSYGEENLYTKKVRELAKISENINLIEDFMERSKFFSFFDEALVLVVNSYRQSGVGNMFIALNSGVKLYLNTKSVIYKWLKKEGFIIHSVCEFLEDIGHGNIKYNAIEALHNINNYKKFLEKYSRQEFQQKIINLR